MDNWNRNNPLHSIFSCYSKPIKHSPGPKIAMASMPVTYKSKCDGSRKQHLKYAAMRSSHWDINIPAREIKNRSN